MLAAAPFSTPALVALDTIRLIITMLGFVLVGFYLRTRWPTSSGRHERARVLGCALALFVLAATRATNFGNPELVWQLPASGVVFLLVGYSALRTTERRRRG
jgi:hypothetical protein